MSNNISAHPWKSEMKDLYEETYGCCEDLASIMMEQNVPESIAFHSTFAAYDSMSRYLGFCINHLDIDYNAEWCRNYKLDIVLALRAKMRPDLIAIPEKEDYYRY